MKKKKIDFQRKLMLNKQVVSALNGNQAGLVIGGAPTLTNACGGATCVPATNINCPITGAGSCWCTEPGGTVACGITQTPNCQTQQLPNGTICATRQNPAQTECVCI
ncbi:class I lanthipeptide [Taibaiella koreensis]|uniref:class I lanthipeptide n=1 Tax=Taibaiella koreensis TaxID=1268548 RepID=UPI0013C338C2|nr:class I lanthipeptide [Taibaiella koreensis]